MVVLHERVRAGSAEPSVRSAEELTPVELRAGRWYKREDLFRGDYGVNGAKLRACQHLIATGKSAGKNRVISAASILSPQNAMAAVTAKNLGMRCTVILGGTNMESALKQRSVAIAHANGADFKFVKVGYNPALQRAAAMEHDADPDSYWLRYGITTAPNATVEELAAFHDTAAKQVDNLPDHIRTLVVPFGSGNTGAGVLYGLARRAPRDLERIVLVGIGPDRRDWLQGRLRKLGAPLPVPVEHYDLHGSGYAKYSDKMPEMLDGITLHPTYEGKVARYLNERQPDWWARRDSTTCLWIVGGPLKAAR